MEGWTMRDVEDFARSKNLPKNDIVGSTYFYVRDRLWNAVSTLERVPVEIDISCQDAFDLADLLKKSSDEKFHRIDVSNLCDHDYIGLAKILTDWTPLLNEKNEYATLFCLLMKWRSHFDDPDAQEMLRLIKNCDDEKAIKAYEMAKNESTGMMLAILDESDEFAKYLSEKLADVKNLSVSIRKKHRIVPHRFFAPIEAPENYIFNNVSEDELYHVTGSVTKCTLRERYVEWGFN